MENKVTDFSPKWRNIWTNSYSQNLKQQLHIKVKNREIPTKNSQQNKLIYYSKCPVETWKEDYVGETDRRIEGKIFDHKKQDKNLHLLKHSCKKNHQSVWEKDFNVLASNYCSNFKNQWSFFNKAIKSVTAR